MERKAVIFLVLGIASALAVPEPANEGSEKRRTGNVCSTDVQCPDNAFCKAGSYCVCKDGYVYAATENDAKECLKVSAYGSPCSHELQCQTALGVHSECYLNICSCKPKSQLVDNRCYKISAVGDRCISDSNCFIPEASPEEQAFCVRGFCSCQLHYSPRKNGTRCMRDAVLGESCQDQQQCAGVGLECRDGTCRCKLGFTAFDDSNVCLETVNILGGSCDYNVQCDGLSAVRGSGAAVCMGGACSCGYNALPRGEPSRCYFTRRPGQQCRIDEECFNEDDQPGFCRNGHCTCDGCNPDFRDFTGGHAMALASIPPLAAILAAAAILA